jgi:hypothetical protein
VVFKEHVFCHTKKKERELCKKFFSSFNVSGPLAIFFILFFSEKKGEGDSASGTRTEVPKPLVHSSAHDLFGLFGAIA